MSMEICQMRQSEDGMYDYCGIYIFIITWSGLAIYFKPQSDPPD